MPPLISLGVIVSLMLTVRFRRDHSTCAALIQLFQEPVRIERFIRHQRAEGDIPDQGRDAFHVVRLTRQQQKADQVAKCVDQGNDFGRQAAARTSNGLSLSPPFAPGCLLVNLNDGAVD